MFCMLKLQVVVAERRGLGQASGMKFGRWTLLLAPVFLRIKTGESGRWIKTRLRREETQ